MFSIYADSVHEFVSRDDPAFNAELPSAKKRFTGQISRDRWALADGQPAECTRYGVTDLSDAQKQEIQSAEETMVAISAAGRKSLKTVNGAPIDSERELSAQATMALGFLVFERAARPLEFGPMDGQ